jgi:hypothetical protein
MDSGSRKSKVESRKSALLLVLAGISAPALSEQTRSLAVRVENHAAVDAATTARAVTIASGIYRRADIPVQLTADSSADAALTIVVLQSAATSTLRPAGDSMGVAPSADDGTRGNVAYVFGDRVVRFAESGRMDPAIVLGCAIAHELGHLLLPVNAHTRDGIMRANWDPSFIPRSGVGLPGFASDQARLLRIRVSGRLISSAQ